MFIVDAHLDIAYNALNYGRSPLLTLAEIRYQEDSNPQRGEATVSFSALRHARVGLIFGTLYVTPATTPFPVFAENFLYHNSAEAHRLAMTQLDYYHRLADQDPTIRLVQNRADLEEVLQNHQTGDRSLLGILILMEGADPIRHPEELELWHERGLRAVGLAWDDTQYAPGAWRAPGRSLPKAGHHLLEVMADYNTILDLTHMGEKATLEALDIYPGPIVATHSNARVLVPSERQLSDTQIRRIGERDGMIGVVLYNSFLQKGWRKGDPKEAVTLDHVVAHIDHMCQLLGDADHVGIGSDFDGGFGSDEIPAELDSSADLPLIAGRLLNYGYSFADVDNIMGNNWVNLLKKVLN